MGATAAIGQLRYRCGSGNGAVNPRGLSALVRLDDLGGHWSVHVDVDGTLAPDLTPRVAPEMFLDVVRGRRSGFAPHVVGVDADDTVATARFPGGAHMICGCAVSVADPLSTVGSSRSSLIADRMLDMTASAGSPARIQIVAALLKQRNRVLLCHRSVERRWYPDVWDLAGGHVESDEVPGKALVRELREELDIIIDEPSYPPMQVVETDEFDMRIWLVEEWAGSPTNAAPHEHDIIGWFELSGLRQLRLAHDSYLPMITELLAEPVTGESCGA